jgi:hypothetical protein
MIEKPHLVNSQAATYVMEFNSDFSIDYLINVNLHKGNEVNRNIDYNRNASDYLHGVGFL